jgi:hypothetical protein
VTVETLSVILGLQFVVVHVHITLQSVLLAQRIQRINDLLNRKSSESGSSEHSE